MPTPSTRLSLLTPIGADAASELRVAIGANATALDGAILYSTNTLAARPASPTVAPAVYKATDTGLTYWWNGTVWQTLVLAGAWSNLTLGTGVGNLSGCNVARIRREGDIAKLSGTIQNTNGSSLPVSSTILTNIPASLSPPVAINLSINTVGSGGGASSPLILSIAASATTVTLGAWGPAWGNGFDLPLEGLNYPLS